MSIEKRGKYYHYSFMVDGKRYRGSTREIVEALAIKAEKIIKLSVKNDTSGKLIVKSLAKKLVNNSMPLNSIFEVFSSSPDLPGGKQMKQIESCMKDFIYFLNDNKVIQTSEITKKMASEYIAYLANNGKYNKKIEYKKGNDNYSYESKNILLSKRTVQDYSKNLKNVFNAIEEQGGVIENPFNGIALKGVKKDKRRRKAFTPDELKLIGEKGKSHYLYPLFITGISTGMREGDICNLKWKDIDLKTNWIRHFKMSKTGGEINVPILPGLREYLLEIKKIDSVYIYPHLHEIYTNNAPRIGKDTTKFLESLGIESSVSVSTRTRRVSIKDIHSLRHTFAYLAAIHGIPLPIVQGVLGHMTQEMTKEYSDHASMEAKQKLLTQMPNYLQKVNNDKTPRDEIREKLLSMNTDNWQKIKDELLEQL